MTLSGHLAFLAGIAAAAALAVRLPRPLFTEAGDRAPARSLEFGLAAAMAVCGAAVFETTGSLSPWSRLALALTVVVLAAVIYADLTFLIIPDIYSAALAVIALAAPWRLPPTQALLGALICGGLLLAVALAWRRFMAVDGLGFGDIKLAAAVGALLGMQSGLMAISVSAVLAAAVIYGLRRVKGEEIAPLIPYGAALAIAGGGMLAAGLL